MSGASTSMEVESTPNPSEQSTPAPPSDTSAPVKYASFYGDVYEASFLGPLSRFSHFPDAAFLTEGAANYASPLLTQRRSFYQSVPTEETSLVGRERRKQKTQSLPNGTPDIRPFHYMSAVCGTAFPGVDVDPFEATLACEAERIAAVYATPPVDEQSFAVETQPTDVSALLQQLLADDYSHVETAKPQEALKETPTASQATPEAEQANRGPGPDAQERAKESFTLVAPTMKRRRTAREGAYKRKKSTPSSEGRSSRFRGVTKHRRSGRWEAHIWIKEMGRQVYLGGYEKEEHAAEAYDVAAIKSKGSKVRTNFDISKYGELTAVMDSISMDELVMIVRRQSQGFSRGTSVFRGVTHHPSGRWEARIGIPGSKHIYLGLYHDEFEAAKWYDRALVRLRGGAAATNFLLSNYQEELAEFHELQRLLQHRSPIFNSFRISRLFVEDASQTEGLKLDASFEQWVKHGRKGAATQESTPGPTRPVEVLSEMESMGAVGVKDAEKERKHLVTQLITRALSDGASDPQADKPAESSVSETQPLESNESV